MSDVLDRVRADNPVRAGSAPPIDAVWARLQDDPGRARRRPGFSWNAAAPVLAVVVALGVAVAAVGLLGRHQRPDHGSSSRPAVVGRSGAGGLPSLAQLMNNFAVLRRPQAPVDRSWRPPSTAVPGLTRLAQTLRPSSGSALAYPVRLFVGVEHARAWTGAGRRSGGDRLELFAVAANGDVGHVPFASGDGYSVFPLDVLQRYGGGWMLWAGVVPDGVRRVRWQFGCPPATKGCLTPRHRNINVRVRDNTAAAAVANTGLCAVCGQPQAVTWYGADGRVVAHYRRGTTRRLSVPPFITTNPTAPLTPSHPVKPTPRPFIPGKLIAQVALQAPHGHRTPAGTAWIYQANRGESIAIRASGLPALTETEGYGVWLTGRTGVKRLGFIDNNQHGPNGQHLLFAPHGAFTAESLMPADAARYQRLLITIEPNPRVKHPNDALLSAPIRR